MKTVPGPGRSMATSALSIPDVIPPWATRRPNRVRRGEVGVEVERIPVSGDLRVELDVPRGDRLAPPRPLPHLKRHGVRP